MTHSSLIHPTAIIETSGTIGDDVEIGPFAVIQGHISLGHGCRVAGHAQLLNRVTLGAGCTVGPGAILGSDPQDIHFDTETESGVEAGADNVFREYTTVHRSTQPGGATRIGSGNFLMTGAHLGHDTVIGDGNNLANNCLLGGHVTVGNRTFLGGGSVYHQFVRVGDLAMVRGNAGVGMDLPPFVMSHRVNEVIGLNRVGLKRAGFDSATLAEIRNAFHLIFRAGLNLSQALAEADSKSWNSPEANTFLDFFRTESKRGICKRLTRRGA